MFDTPSFFDAYDFPSPSQEVHKKNLNTFNSRLDEICGRSAVGSSYAVLDELGVVDPGQRSLYAHARTDIVRCRTSTPSLSYTDRMMQIAAVSLGGTFSAIFAYGFTRSEDYVAVIGIAGSIGVWNAVGSVLLAEQVESRRLRLPTLEESIKRAYFHKIIDGTYEQSDFEDMSDQDSAWEA